MAANLYFSSSWVFRLYAIAIAPILLVLLRNSFSSLANPEESRLSLWILIGVVAFFGWKGFINYYCHGLHRYPGPILAKFTKLWHLLDVNRNSHQLSMIELHRKNGPVIRIGPNTLSISDPRYIPQIYGVSVSFPKSSMYNPFSPRIRGKPLPSLLSERNEQVHTALRKPIAGFYSLATLRDYEPLVDTMIENLVAKLEPFAQDGSVCDMASWLRWFAFDMITNLTFGESLGFMDRGEDVRGFIQVLDNHIDDTAILSTMPWAALLWKHNPIVGYFKQEYTVLTPFTRRKVQDHIAYQAAKAQGTSLQSRPTDFTDRFLGAATTLSASGSSINVNLLVNWALGNFSAGGDTTAIALRSVLYHVLRSSGVYARLSAELTKAQLSVPVSWKAAQHLPYLDACIREALRIHPPIGLGLERDVPSSSHITLPDGHRLPAGVQVSMNAWVIARDPATFGPDPDMFRPERWLQEEGESLDVFGKRLADMKRADLVFGAGSRSCLGKNVSFLEIYKAVPSLLLAYRFQIVDGGMGKAEWEVQNRWIVRQSGFDCFLKVRAEEQG